MAWAARCAPDTSWLVIQGDLDSVRSTSGWSAAGWGDPDRFARQPLLHLTPGVGDGHRVTHHDWVRR